MAINLEKNGVMVGLIISQPADLPDPTANVAIDMFWFHSNVYKKILPLGGSLCHMIVAQQIRQRDTESCWGFDANVSGPVDSATMLTDILLISIWHQPRCW